MKNSKSKIEEKPNFASSVEPRGGHGNYLPLQVFGFSPVRIKLRVFRPISQLEGFDFSPVTEKAPGKKGLFLGRQSLHPIRSGARVPQ
jgi:hypothetical protein